MNSGRTSDSVAEAEKTRDQEGQSASVEASLNTTPSLPRGDENASTEFCTNDALEDVKAAEPTSDQEGWSASMEASLRAVPSLPTDAVVNAANVDLPSDTPEDGDDASAATAQPGNGRFVILVDDAKHTS
jgi:hypothetical protein